MRGSKLIKTINILSKNKCKKLLLFVQNPIYNSRKDIIKTLQIIIVKKKSLISGKLSEIDLFFSIFPNAREFNDNKFRDILFYSYKLLEDFIVTQEVLNNEYIKQLLLSNYYEENYLYNESSSITKKSIKNIEKSTNIVRKESLYLFDLKTKLYLLEDIDYIKNRKILIVEALQNLDSYYFTEKLKWSHELLAGSQYSSQGYNTPLLNSILSEIVNEPYSSNPLAQSYYLLTLFYKKNYSLNKYFSLKKAILSIIDKVDIQEKRSLIIDLNNYIQKLYKDETNFSFVKEMQGINELGIRYDVFIKKGKFNSHNAMNIVNVALRLEMTSWVKDFIDSISNIIDDNNALIIIKAMVAFQENNFDKVQDLLLTVKFVDAFFAINAKSFLAKSYYKLNQLDLLHHHLAAMDLYFRRHKKLAQETIKSNLNFILTLKKIVINNNNSSKLRKILQKINNLNNVAYKIWLQNELKELLK